MDNDAMLYAFDSGELELRSFAKRGGRISDPGALSIRQEGGAI